MRIEVHAEAGTRYRLTVHRPDGAVVELLGGGWNRIGGPVGRVPHDLAHLVVESALGLERGLWGVLAAGGLVQNARVAASLAAMDARLRAEAAAWAAHDRGAPLVRTWPLAV